MSKVALDVLQQQVDVFVEHPSGTKFRCPDVLSNCHVMTTHQSVSRPHLLLIETYNRDSFVGELD